MTHASVFPSYAGLLPIVLTSRPDTKSCQTEINVKSMTREEKQVLTSKVEWVEWTLRCARPSFYKVDPLKPCLGPLQSTIWRRRRFLRRTRRSIPGTTQDQRPRSPCACLSRRPLQGQNYKARIDAEHPLWKMQREGRKRRGCEDMSQLRRSRSESHPAADGPHDTTDAGTL